MVDGQWDGRLAPAGRLWLTARQTTTCARRARRRQAHQGLPRGDAAMGARAHGYLDERSEWDHLRTSHQGISRGTAVVGVWRDRPTPPYANGQGWRTRAL